MQLREASEAAENGSWMQGRLASRQISQPGELSLLISSGWEQPECAGMLLTLLSVQEGLCLAMQRQVGPSA